MGIHRSDETKNLCAQCDKCHCVVDFEDDVDFIDAKNLIDMDGWSTKRVDGKWKNYCPDCQ